MRSIWLSLSIFLMTTLIVGCSVLNTAAQDQAALDQLREAGSDMTKPHPFDFYIYHPEKAGAIEICGELQDEGFKVTVREGAQGNEWLCFASHSFVPSVEKLAELEEKFEGLVEVYGGEYDDLPKT